MTYDDTAKKLAVKVIGTVESDLNYSAINYSDPITVGVAQWFGTRAAGVLERMRTTNASQWYGVAASLNNQLATIPQFDSYWNSRYLTRAEGDSLAGVLARNQVIQNTQLSEDLDAYVVVFEDYGFNKDSQTEQLIYFMSMHHQGPAYALEVVQTLDTSATLAQFHSATLAHPVLGQYGARYRTTYDLITAADVGGVDPPPPAPDPDPVYPNGNARRIERAGDLLIATFQDNEKVTFVPTGRDQWIPKTAAAAPPPPAPVQPPPPEDNASTGAWFHPAPGANLTSPYGPRSFDGFHWGADLSSTTAATGVDIKAVTALVITQAYNAGTGGNATAGGCVKGHTLDGAYTFCYYHMAPGSVIPNVGDTVTAGTKIGVEGQTGNVTGTHLHFEAYQGNYSDPWPGYAPTSPVEPLGILRAHGVSI